ncbi:MAG: energy-coupling factor transporter transmembrane component T [Chlorobiaceae bacterium]
MKGTDRSTLLVTAIFIVAVVSVPKFDLAAVTALGAYPVFLLTSSGTALRTLSGHLLKLSPFILFMAAGNLLLDRTPAMEFMGATFTGGMLSSAVILAKTTVTLSALLLITLSMPFHRICRALAELHLPDVLVTQLLLLYRYSWVLQEEASSMQRARNLRSFGRRGKELRRTAPLLGSLLMRTTGRAERIYRAMEARGFSGALLLEEPAAFSAGELGTTTLWALGFMMLRLIF